MKAISFGWTTAALLAGRKTATRRQWDRAYARRFRRGDRVAALDRAARFGGRRVAVIELTASPIEEWTDQAPESDWEAEGFGYLSEIGATVGGRTPGALWEEWRQRPERLWVVRFRLVEALVASPAGRQARLIG